MKAYAYFYRMTVWTVSLMLLTGSLALAQPEGEEANEVDTTEISWRNKRFIIISDEDGKRIEIKERDETIAIDDEDEDVVYDGNSYDYRNKEARRQRSRSDVDLLALDLGVTNYYVNGVYGTDAASPELDLRPFRPGGHVALHFLPTQVSLIGRGVVNLKTAITVDWSNYYFTEDITLLEGTETLGFDTTGISFTKNKLMTRYAQIPLLLNFNTAPGSDDGLSVSVGVYG
ncbi:MAG: hypothetical protein D6722_03320, partial [Bacteroidetes bacterium]